MDKSQEELVLEYLKTHKNGMTSKDAFDWFGILQMPKRVWNLKRQGYKILSIPQHGKNRYGKMVNFVRYTLVG